ncbi:MAG: 50S ribosomal protein L23 [Candidatus Uhrbacteria bacterium GW2011_GWA2_52_8d]|uniref:Large ribosomal subunit protein uL23 n=1 Tax=Candidatus Uhrbacteria bacterium GW2011_GWA2_52_8d TaxID=1618979 RepID=A0A0G1XQF7_9BACT|nr:MAG: 50S ribosomal protein L23 [Candidatus Uhrbacteria bacterium GW2011_GWA2_52_8d]
MGIFNRLKKTKATEEKPSSQKVSESSVASGARIGVDTSDVIVKPLISEKSAILAGVNQYVFVVRKDANRIQVRSAMKMMYGVSPLSINILNVRGKKVRFGRREGVRSDWKKAIITLPAGQTINVYEGV